MAALQQTPLYALHLALAAKMVPFAEYQMPLQYAQGIIKEHLHCRAQAGLFDISHMGQCLLTGAELAQQLEALVPSNIQSLEVGQSRYTLLTNPAGGIIDDIIITRLENAFMLVLNAACKAKDIAYLQANLQADIQLLSEQALLALQGPMADQVIRRLSSDAATLKFMQARQTHINGIACTVSRSGYTGEDGFEISVAQADACALAELLLSFAEVQPIGLGARDTLRLEAGLSLYGHELSAEISPVEAGLQWLIDKQRVGYPGAELIQQQMLTGAARKKVGLLVLGKIPVRDGCELYTANDELVGVVTSGGFSPTLNRPIALALISRECIATRLYAKVRNKQISLQLAALPFVPHHYYRG